MKKLYFLCLTLLMASLSFGQVIASDGFSYPDGSLVGNGGWVNHSGTLGDLLVSSNQAVIQHGTPSEDANVPFTPVAGEIFFGIDFSVTSGSVIPGTDNEYFVSFRTGFNLRGRIDVVPGTGGGDYTVGISSSTSTAQAIWATDLTFGTMYRAIVSYDQDSGLAKLWIDASSSSDTNISGTADGSTSIETFALRQSDSDNNETILVDDLMIGQTFNDVLIFVPSTDQTVSVTAPADGTVFAPGTSSVDVEFSATNLSGGETFDIDVNGSLFTGVTSPYPVPTVDGQSYNITVNLMSGATVLDFEGVDFSVGNLITVADITALRADVTNNGLGRFYEITNGSLVTHTDGFRNRKWIQDTNISGVLIYDQEDVLMASPYVEGDMVTGLRGTTEESNGILRFVPTSDSGTLASSGNPVTPQVVTVPAFNAAPNDYESELIELQNVSFPIGDGMEMFATGQNYDINDGAENTIMRTDFFSADYIGTIIPMSTTTLPRVIGVAGEFNGTSQIYVRSLSDLLLSTPSFETTGFKVYPNPTATGFVNIVSANNENIAVTVYDILGKQVINETVSNNRLNVSALNTGIYILKISQNNASVTKKLVIK